MKTSSALPGLSRRSYSFLCLTAGLLAAAGLHAQSYQWSVLAGKPGESGFKDGTGDEARFYAPRAISLDDDGVLVVADRENHAIRKVTKAGVVTTVAGRPDRMKAVNGDWAEAGFNSPMGIFASPSFDILVADRGAALRRIISEGGVIDVRFEDTEELKVKELGGSDFAGIVELPSGDLVVANRGMDVLLKVSVGGELTVLAGSPYLEGSSDGAGRQARFKMPDGLALDAQGNLYVTDSHNATIRKVTSDGRVSTIAGTPKVMGNADGVGAAAQFKYPVGIAVDATGRLFVGDSADRSVSMIDASGRKTTIGRDLGAIQSIVVDKQGVLYLADMLGHCIRCGVPVSGAPVAASGAAPKSAAPAADEGTVAERVLKLVGGVLGVDDVRQVTPKTRFVEDLYVGGLDMSAVSALLSIEFSVHLTVEEDIAIDQMRTVGDLISFMEAKMKGVEAGQMRAAAGKSGGTPPPAAASAGGERLTPQSVIALLGAGFTPAEIIADVQKHGYTGGDAASLQQIRAVGGNVDLILALTKAARVAPTPAPAPAPAPGRERL